MSVYYCHKCGVEQHGFGNVSTGLLLDSTYQLGKFMKHTIPSTGYNLASVFNDPSTQAYERYMVNTLASGCYEIDDQGRRNIIWVAGSPIGAQYRKGEYELSENSVKVVLSTDPQRIHAYPISSTSISTGFCSDCSTSVIR